MTMDASDLIPNFQNHKRFKGGNDVENEDKISSLPDSLLHCILSFLPTKYAVGSSLLSNRWNSLWTSVYNLDFNDSQFHSKILLEKRDSDSFMNFVDRVLSLLDVPYIHKFSLVCVDIHDESRVNTWISTIIERNIRVIIIEMEFDSPCRFSYSLFTSESLEILKIQSDSYFNIPAVVCFPNLKILHFKFIKFSSGFKDLQVSMTCPLLKDFVLQDCEWLEIKTVEIFAPELKKCFIDDNAYKGENGLSECQLKVHADALIFLELISSLSYELCLYNTSVLVKASIHLSSQAKRNHRASKILKGICNVKELILSDATVVIFARADLTAQLAAFSNLINLTVSVGLNDFFGEESELRVGQLIHLLSHLPNVQTFRFTNGTEDCAFEERAPPRKQIQCLLPQLKFVELDCFYGDKKELYFINYVVNNAKMLEIITISCSLTLSEDPVKKKRVVKKLRSLPKSSIINLVGFSKGLQI